MLDVAKGSVADRGDFYVYLIPHPVKGVMIYAGKGRGKRIDCHRKGHSHNDRVYQTIKEYGFVGYKVAWGLTEEQAFEFEEELIRTIGREDLGTGTLYNLSVGGEGWSPTPEMRERLRAARVAAEAATAALVVAARKAARLADMCAFKPRLDDRAKYEEWKRDHAAHRAARAEERAARAEERAARAEERAARLAAMTPEERMAAIKDKARTARRAKMTPEERAAIKAARAEERAAIRAEARTARRATMTPEERSARCSAAQQARRARDAAFQAARLAAPEEPTRIVMTPKERAAARSALRDTWAARAATRQSIAA